MEHKCPHCGTEYEGNFCPECGEKWQEEKTCPNCGAILAGGAKFCNGCGYSFVTHSSPASSSSPHGDTPAAVSKELSPKTAKLYSVIQIMPAVLLGFFAVLSFLFFLAPVAIMPGGELFGEKISSESYGNVYQIGNFEGSSLTLFLTALIIFATGVLIIALLLAVIFVFAKLRYKRVKVFGKTIFLHSMITCIGYALLFVIFLISCIILGQISNEDGGIRLMKAGAAPILTLTFSLVFCLVAAACAFIGYYFRKTDPALVKAQNAKCEQAKPTVFETWLKSHKKAAVSVSAVLAAVIVMSVIVPIAIANRHNGVYYAYNSVTEEYDTKRFYKLSGGTWMDEDGNEGKISFDGKNATLSYDLSGGEDKTGFGVTKMEGTIQRDILKVEGALFAKKGHKHKYQDHMCVCGQNSSWKLEFSLNEAETEYSVTGLGECTDKEIVIPSEYNGKPVTEIGEYAFLNCKRLKSVTIGNGVTSIGNEAFNGCSKLKSIVIPDSVTEIGEYAFENCSGLKSVTIGNGVTSIGNGAFAYCSGLKSIVIPESVTSIGEYAFSGCSGLTSIVIPDSVTSIGGSAFAYCSGLTSIEVAEENKTYRSEKNCLIEIETNTLILGCKNSEIPDSVTSIGGSAFLGCSRLTSITIPESVTSIGGSAFLGCSKLKSITIPESVTEIGSLAFDGCSKLKSITIPDSVTSIGGSAFRECKRLKSITIPESVTLIGNSAFWGTAYYNDKSKWENDVLYIGNHLIAAKDTISGACTIKEGTKTIADGAFSFCRGLTSIVIPDGVTSIGSDTFNGCRGLTSIVIPDGVTSIGEYAFYECSKLKSITIPDGVTSIGWGAFEDCDGLTSVTFENTEGWQVSKYSDMSNATSLDSSNLSDPATAAEYLTDVVYGYGDYYWKRS